MAFQGLDTRGAIRLALVCLLALLAMPVLADDSPAGKLELDALSSLLTGNFGMAVGLLITLWGIWKAFVQGETGVGFVLLACGAALTVFPGVFNTATAIVKPMVSGLTGH